MKTRPYEGREIMSQIIEVISNDDMKEQNKKLSRDIKELKEEFNKKLIASDLWNQH